MRRLLFIIQKEFIQIIRNKAILPMMTVLPIIQLIVLSFAATNEVKNVRISLVDQDHSSISRLLIGKIQASDRFTLVQMPPDRERAEMDLQSGEADIVLVLPPGLERGLWREHKGEIQLLVNAINGQQATVGANYLQQILISWQNELMADAPPVVIRQAAGLSRIEVSYRNWFNPDLDYKTFMVPGILGELVTILVMVLTAMNVVREREIGTIEQINVTPIRPWQFILGKMIPFLLIGLMLLTIGLIAGKLIFDIPMVGNLWIIFAYCVINVAAVLGMGLLLSNFADTQQQAIFLAMFFVIIFVLMSGLFTPIESMPKWAQQATIPNPIAHFVAVMRQVLLKGSDFQDVKPHFIITACLAIVTNSLAVWTYRKVN